MGTTVADVRGWLYGRLDGLPAVVAAYLTVRSDDDHFMHFCTLLERRDSTAESAIVKLESEMEKSHPALRFDFTTIHLLGRDRAQFIPPEAHFVKTA